MARFDQYEQAPASAAPPPAVRPDYMDPSDAEQEFNTETPPSWNQPIPGSRMQPTQVASADNAVPLPERAPAVQNSDSEAPPMPERGERSPTMQRGPFVQQTDSRYSDSANVIIADTILGGMLPWIQAATDIAMGRAPAEQFDNVRMEHEQRIEALKSENQGLVKGAENALPLLSGLGLSMLKGPKTIAGGVARGAAVGGAQGAAQGFTSGDPAEPTMSSNRVANAVGGATKGAALGAVGGALPPTATKFKDAYNASKAATAAAAKKQDIQSRAAATKAKNAEAKRVAEVKKMRADEERARDDQLVSKFKSYRQQPETAVKKWAQNREMLQTDPVDAFKQQAAFEPTLESFSRVVNLSPAAISQRLYGKGIKPETPAERRLWEQIQEVDMAWQAHRRRTGTNDAGSNSSAGGNGPKSRPESAPAKHPAGSATGSAGSRSRSKSKPAGSERKPGDEPIRVPTKPQRRRDDY
jgi:hypothetical protein